MTGLTEDDLTRLDEEARGLLDRQLEERRELDAKASDIVKLNTLVLGVLLSALSLATRLGHPDGRGGPGWIMPLPAVVLVGAGSLLLGAAMILGVQAHRTSRLAVGPRAGDLRGVVKTGPDSGRFRERLVVTYTFLVEQNRSNLEETGRLVRRAFSLMSWGLAGVGTGTVVFMYMAG